MKFSAVKAKLPSVSNLLLAVFSAILLILAFPGFELWFMAYIALIPLLFAVERQKDSPVKSFLTGWVFGTIFIFGSCWWLTYSLINYGGIPIFISYFLLLGAAVTVGIFFAFFTVILSIILNRLGAWAIFSAPFLWTATEFLRFYLTGNNWNAIAYSQAFVHIGFINYVFLNKASVGGIYLVGFLILCANSFLFCICQLNNKEFLRSSAEKVSQLSPIKQRTFYFASIFLPITAMSILGSLAQDHYRISQPFSSQSSASVVAIQANVPMSGLKYEDWIRLRERHIQLAEKGLQELADKGQMTDDKKIIVIFPESPMNFEYTNDREFQQFLREFTAKDKVSVLFNAAEPTEDDGYYNAAVMVNEQGRKIAEYDKIHLVPFGEYVPLPRIFGDLIPPIAGNFEFGKNYNLMPFGDAKAGVMICFESHFPTLSRRLVGDGADVLVEMTNDGYLGPTPVLRQHLASTVFRAIETNRPVLRTTNVGITAYVNEKGEVIEPSMPYTEDTRIWSVAKSDGGKTFYVKYGDWFAWVCLIAGLGLLFLSFWKRKEL